MLRSSEWWAVFSSVIVVFLVLIAPAGATAMNFTVHAGEDVTVPLSLAVEDRVTIKFTVVGGQTSSTLDFYLACPNGTRIGVFNSVGSVNYGFVCDAEGEYTMHFSNVGSSEDKLVSLDYEVGHYILGIPQMLFLAIVVVLVCVAMVAAFILTGKTH